MCDDFFDDDMDSLDDSLFEADNDQEDLADNDGEDLIDELNTGNSIVTPDHFDLTEALVLGTMVGGIAYSEAIDEKNQSKLARSKGKPTK